MRRHRVRLRYNFRRVFDSSAPVRSLRANQRTNQPFEFLSENDGSVGFTLKLNFDFIRQPSDLFVNTTNHFGLFYSTFTPTRCQLLNIQRELFYAPADDGNLSFAYSQVRTSVQIGLPNLSSIPNCTNLLANVECTLVINPTTWHRSIYCR